MNPIETLRALARAMRPPMAEFRCCHGGWIHPAACHASHLLGGRWGQTLAHSLAQCLDGHTADEILRDMESAVARQLPMTAPALHFFFDLRTPAEAAATADRAAALLARAPGPARLDLPDLRIAHHSANA